MYSTQSQQRMDIDQFIVQTINSYCTSVRYLRIVYDIIYSDPNYWIPQIISNVKQGLYRQNPTGKVASRYCEKLVEFWSLNVAYDVLRNVQQLTNEEAIAIDDIEARLNELNIGELNRSNVGVGVGNIPTNQTANIFTSGTVTPQDVNIIANQQYQRQSYDVTKSDDGILDIINNSKQNKEEIPTQPKVEEKVETTQSINIPNSSAKDISRDWTYINTSITDDPEDNSQNEPDNDSEMSPEEYVKNALSNGEIEVIDETNSNPKENEEVINKSHLNVIESHAEAVPFTLCDLNVPNDINWKLKEAVNMTEEERVKYIEHELNQEELARLNKIATYDKDIKQVIEEEKKSEQPTSLIRTDDLYFINKVVYTNRSSDICGTDEYFDSIHVDGKGVVAIIGELGATNSVYINNDAVRNTILGFNDKVLSASKFDTFIKYLSDSGRSGNIVRKVLGLKLVNWVNDLIELPNKNGVPVLKLTGDFEEDVRQFILGAGIGNHVDSAMEVLRMKFDTIKSYLPNFKTLSSLYLGGNHLPDMDIIPADEYGKCIASINYAAMVRIPVDFMALGLDVSRCVDEHFIAKQEDFKQFFLLEEVIVNLAKYHLDSKEFNNDTIYIKLIIADNSGNVVIFKNIGDGIGIMTIDKR